MYKLFFLILVVGEPLGEIKTNLLFQTNQECMSYVYDNWDGYVVDDRMQIKPDCRIEI